MSLMNFNLFHVLSSRDRGTKNLSHKTKTINESNFMLLKFKTSSFLKCVTAIFSSQIKSPSFYTQIIFHSNKIKIPFIKNTYYSVLFVCIFFAGAVMGMLITKMV